MKRAALVASLLSLTLSLPLVAAHAQDTDASDEPSLKVKPTPERWYNERAKDTGFRLGIGPQAMIYSGDTGFGGELSFGVQTSEDFLFSIHVGYNTFPASDATEAAGGSSGSIIPVQFGFTYVFPVSPQSMARPFFGVVAGAAFQKTAFDFSNTLFAASARLGIELAFSNAVYLQIDPRLGILRSDFVFTPTLSLQFLL